MYLWKMLRNNTLYNINHILYTITKKRYIVLSSKDSDFFQLPRRRRTKRVAIQTNERSTIYSRRRPFPLKYSWVVSDWANVSRFKCSMRPRKSPSYRMEKGSSSRCNDLEGAGCDKCGERRNTWEKSGDESDRCAHGMKMHSGRKKERCSRRWEGERVRTRQLPTRPKTAIKRVGKQTTFPFCRSRSD